METESGGAWQAEPLPGTKQNKGAYQRRVRGAIPFFLNNENKENNKDNDNDHGRVTLSWASPLPTARSKSVGFMQEVC